MDKISRPHVCCTCKYKCAQSTEGYRMIPQSTKRHHSKKDEIEEVYQCPSLVDTTGIVQGGSHGYHENQEQNPDLDPINSLRLAKCICHLCGQLGRLIPRVTQRRHMSIHSFTRRMHVQEPIAIGEVDCVTLDGDQRMEEFYTSITDAIELEVESTTERHESPPQENEAGEQAEKFNCLDDAILETVIELFSVLDHHKVSIACQKKVLKVLYRGINTDIIGGGSSNNHKDYRGLSLARLFTLAGPEWRGGKTGMAAPRTWNRLMEVYQMNGMVVPDKWLICTGEKGIGHAPAVLEFSADFQTCPIEDCKIEKSQMCAFSYLPIAKIFTLLFQSQTFCHEILYMWRKRSEWLAQEGEVQGRKPSHIDEFWHGSKLQDYAKFWDTKSTWKLPVICPNPTCKKTYKLWPSVCEELEREENFDKVTGCYHFPCVDCASEINQSAIHVKGSPFNIALMGHWDGFQAATTVQKDCWTVEIVILNGGKRPLPDSKIAKPIPLLFIPMSSRLLQKNKEHHLLQAFLKPLWADLQECFVHGFPIKFEYPIPSSLVPLIDSSDPIIVRVMTMSWTGDGPAQSKIGGTLLMGYNGCRRDLLQSESIVSTTGKQKKTVVYNGNRKQSRFPPVRRDVEAMNYFGKCLREAANKEQRSECKKQSGLSYYSDMWCLYDLYGFDISLDLVHDPMHLLALGVLKSFNDRLLASCNHVEVKKLMKVLQCITKNRPLGLGARWPRPPLYVKNVTGGGSKWKFSNYKAEEHLLFTLYCVGPILEDLGHTLATPLGGEGAILIHLSRLFFVHSRKQGWTKDMLKNARLHFLAWRVLTEETYGPNGQIVEHIIGNAEILDDIERHGHHDIFWCYGFERMVSGYNNITTNQKSSELSYAQYFCRQQFAESFFQLQQDKDGCQRDQRTLDMLHGSLYPRIVGLPTGDPCAIFYSNKVCVVTSTEKAKQLWTLVKFLNKPDLPAVTTVAKGIAIGQKQGVEHDIGTNGEILSSLRTYWLAQNILDTGNDYLLKNRVEVVRAVLVNGVQYRKNDLAVVENISINRPSQKCKIQSFFLHEFLSHYQIFFDALCYTEVSTEREAGEELQIRSECTNMNLLFEDEPGLDQCRNMIFPVNRLLHRFMAHPTRMKPRGKKVIVAYELDDIVPRTHLLALGRPGCCPPWLVCHDVVIVTLFPAEKHAPLHLAWITSVHYDANIKDNDNNKRIVEVAWLAVDHSSPDEIPGHEIFKVNSMDWVFTLLWRNVLTVLEPSLFEKMDLNRSNIQRWNAPHDWTKDLFLQRSQIQGPPIQQYPYDRFQYLIRD